MSEETTCPGVECCYPIFENCDAGGTILPPLSLDTTILPCQSLCLGDDYEATVSGSGGEAPYVYELVSGALPDGLSFDAATGVISGTTTTAGSFAFTIQVTDVNGTQSEAIYILGVLQITTTELDDYTVGVPYYFQLVAIGGTGAYGWRIESGALPDGLSLAPDGLITGTPTGGEGSGTIEFEVVDTTCEALTESLVSPLASLSAISEARVETYRGFVEYTSGGDNTGQLYKRVDYTGTMTQIAFPNFNEDEAIDNTQCGGFQYVYSSYDQIDNYGNVLNLHRKDMMLMCSASHPSLFEITVDTDPNIFPILHPPALYGYCWSADPESCAVCNPSDASWGLFINDATFGATDYPTNMVWDAGNLVLAPTVLTHSGNAFLTGGVMLQPGQVEGFPTNTGLGTYSEGFPFVRLESSGDWSATLSEPYTDADADATAVIYTGTSKTAENAPNYQITGANNFITRRSRITTVDFTILCTNLVAGEDYTVLYNLLYSAGGDADFTVNFTAAGTTHEVTGTIPEPAANMKTTVRNPRIQYTV